MLLKSCSRLLGTLLVVSAVVYGCTLFGCTKVFDLDGHAGAVDSLCDQYNACFGAEYPGCTELSSARLTNADAEARQSWLERFSVSGCLDACKRTYECMDNAPFCGSPGESCELVEGCCGFLQGRSQCIAGNCCLPDGVACTATDDCCFSECMDGTCGGAECSEIGDACASDASCCGDLRCSDLGSCFACVPSGLFCSIDEECCDGDCVDGICISTCQDPGTDCTSNDQCCSNNCSPIGVGGDVSQCTQADCIPDGVFCSTDEECCGLFCDNNICGGVLCTNNGNPCTEDVECCDQKCVQADINQTAAKQCCELPIEGLCSHNECEVGPPLHPGCAGMNGDTGCIDLICKRNPRCCCNYWTQECVDLVPMECGGTVCATDPF